jgi:hypothetical protein
MHSLFITVKTIYATPEKVSCAKKEAKGRNLCIGVQTARKDFVWNLASRFSTQRRTSKFH